jgi:hypothetical protein
VLILLASTYQVIKTNFLGGALTGQNLAHLSLGEDTNNSAEQSTPTAWEWGDGVGYGDVGVGIVHIAELSKCADSMT